MTKLEELKAALDAYRDTCNAARAVYATVDAAIDDARAELDAAWDAYDDELKKHKENGAMSKSEELKQTRDAEAAADAWAKVKQTKN